MNKNNLTNEEEEEKKPLPVYQCAFTYHKRYADDEESDEEVVDDDQRDELNWGCDFILNPNMLTYTRLKFPINLYQKYSTDKVLHDPDYPVPTVTKLALQRYNEIEGTNYQYVGLVKAYKAAVDGFHYTVRFKACLPAQPPVCFQSMIYQGVPDRSNTVLVNVEFVHPLASLMMPF